ncbi:hypothetical protein [Williamwhitmania taraxaci]|uniref:Uncharacterized protein n=1 Tax=Williamwhitmania taraxaci TaxID=1640674 RepID=A0A1G6SW05_9BACT|nr:hypothetical protein [Williamwhitmania taraxaci]SDD20315.1 hypothetical protein SAMN05216323_11022 [Williamwhitmania taraxaci]
MNIFKNFFGNTNESEKTSNEHQSSTDSNNSQGENLFYPILKVGHSSAQKITTADGQILDLPESSLPVFQQIGKTELSVIIGVDKGSHFEWLQNKHLTKSVDETIKEAFKILVSKDKLGIGQIEDKGLENCKIGILQSESGLASSYILVESIWEKIYSFCNSTDITFIVPNQNSFIFCSSSDKDFFSAELFLNAMTEYLPNTEPKPLSKNIFIKRKGEPIIQKD